MINPHGAARHLVDHWTKDCVVTQRWSTKQRDALVAHFKSGLDIWESEDRVSSKQMFECLNFVGCKDLDDGSGVP